MTEPTRRQIDADIEKSKDLFLRADVGPVARLDGQRPKRVLLALDGSSQDVALVLMAKQLRGRLGCTFGFYCPPTNANELDETTRSTLVDIAAQEILLPQRTEHNYDGILAASEIYHAEMLIVPCPFGRDFQSLGEDSTGTVIDVLTARSTIPLVAIRRPDAIGRDPTTHLRIILTGENPAAGAAANWAVGLIQPGGRMELLLLVEQSFYENFRQTMQSLQPGVEISYEDLERALAATHARLHTALRYAASSKGFDYELLVRYEADEQPITPEHPRTHPALMVLALERGDHDSQGEVQDYIRRSPHPSLVVSVP